MPKLWGAVWGNKEAEIEAAKCDCNNKKGKREFWLVLHILWTFAFLVLLVVLMPGEYLVGVGEEQREHVAEQKYEILALFFAAFGPWIAAGAAYFFGRENLREAYRGIADTLPNRRRQDSGGAG